MTKGIKHVQDGHSDNNNNAASDNISQIHKTLFALSFERDLKKILNSYLTSEQFFPPLNGYDFCIKRENFLAGNFNVYLATGEETRMMISDENEIDRTLEMPFLSEYQMANLQDKVADNAFKKQKNIFVNKIIQLTDIIFQEIEFHVSQKEQYEIFQREYEFFIRKLSEADKNQFPLEFIEAKFQEWLFKFEQFKSESMKAFCNACHIKIEEIKQLGIEVAKLSIERGKNVDRAQHFHFHYIEFKRNASLHSSYQSITSYAKANLDYKCTGQEKDAQAIMKFNASESVYIADFQKQRLDLIVRELEKPKITEKITGWITHEQKLDPIKKESEKPKITKWITHVQHLLLSTCTIDEKKQLRVFAKKALIEKKIFPKKLNLTNLTFNLYELLQYSEKFPILNYLLDPKKQLFFLHSDTFCALFPLSAKLDMEKLEDVCKEINALEAFYKSVESFLNGQLVCLEPTLLRKNILDQDRIAFSEIVTNISRKCFFTGETLLSNASFFLESIQAERYQEFLRNIYGFFDKYFVNKSVEQFDYYFEQFSETVLSYIGKIKVLDDKTKQLVIVACQSLANEYHNRVLVDEIFSVTMQLFNKDNQVIEESINEKAVTRKDSDSNISNLSFPFFSHRGGIGGNGVRDRSLTVEKGPANKLTKASKQSVSTDTLPSMNNDQHDTRTHSMSSFSSSKSS